MMTNRPQHTELVLEENIPQANQYDGIIYVHVPGEKVTVEEIKNAITLAGKHDADLENQIAVLPLPKLSAERLICASTGRLDPDFDDVRALKTAAARGVERARKAGVRKPLLVLEECASFPDGNLVTLLGALEAIYMPIQLRELDPERKTYDSLGVYTPNPDKTRALIKTASLLELGRRTACDIGDADPERMSPPNIEAYIKSVFKSTKIGITVISDVAELTEKYPLFEAVNRAASVVERHQGRIVFLEYTPEGGEVTETLYLVGKGVTYDTGGADLKVNGHMAGMSRDKCGAAAAAGFMRLVAEMKPPNLKIVAGLSLVRNSIGSNSYVSDELIKARSGVRVRVGNTDAEGRMVMADVLCKFKEDATQAINPHLFTIATLTGHAFIAVGEGYSIVMDNGPARKAGTGQKLQAAGDIIGDPFEISRLHKDDIDFFRGRTESEDVLQGTNDPSSRIPRGHQGPAGFMILASGLDKYGSGSSKALKYSHLDIAASAGEFPKPATGAPVLALAKAFPATQGSVRGPHHLRGARGGPPAAVQLAAAGSRDPVAASQRPRSQLIAGVR